VIAAHTSRMAIDALVRREASLFPHPAYVIGLSSDEADWRSLTAQIEKRSCCYLPRYLDCFLVT
jgi:hypothetical protein